MWKNVISWKLHYRKGQSDTTNNTERAMKLLAALIKIMIIVIEKPLRIKKEIQITHLIIILMIKVKQNDLNTRICIHAHTRKHTHTHTHTHTQMHTYIHTYTYKIIITIIIIIISTFELSRYACWEKRNSSGRLRFRLG